MTYAYQRMNVFAGALFPFVSSAAVSMYGMFD